MSGGEVAEGGAETPTTTAVEAEKSAVTAATGHSEPQAAQGEPARQAESEEPEVVAAEGEEDDLEVTEEHLVPAKAAKGPLSPAAQAKHHQKKAQKAKRAEAAVKKNRKAVAELQRRLHLLQGKDYDFAAEDFEEAVDRDQRLAGRIQSRIHQISKALQPFDPKFKEDPEKTKFALNWRVGRKFAETPIKLGGDDFRSSGCPGLDEKLQILVNRPLKNPRPHLRQFAVPDSAEVRKLVDACVVKYKLEGDTEQLFIRSMDLLKRVVKKRREQDQAEAFDELEEEEDEDEDALAELAMEEGDEEEEEEEEAQEEAGPSAALTEDAELNAKLAANDAKWESEKEAKVAFFKALEEATEEGDGSDTEESPKRTAKEQAEGEDEEDPDSDDDSDDDADPSPGPVEEGGEEEAAGSGEASEEVEVPPDSLSTSEDDSEAEERRKAKRKEAWKEGLGVASDDSDLEAVEIEEGAAVADALFPRVPTPDLPDPALIAAAALIQDVKRLAATEAIPDAADADPGEVEEVALPPSRKRAKKSIQQPRNGDGDIGSAAAPEDDIVCLD